MAFATIALVVALGATAASTYVKSQSAKGVAKKTRSLQREAAELAVQRGREADDRTRKTADQFKPEERTALFNKEDTRNRGTLDRLHEDVSGTEATGGQTFKGKISQGSKDALVAGADVSKKKNAALREAQAKFNTPGGASNEELQLLRSLGIDNNTIASFSAGDQRSKDAAIRGIEPSGLGLAQFLDTLALVSGAASIGAGLGAGAGGATTGTIGGDIAKYGVNTIGPGASAGGGNLLAANLGNIGVNAAGQSINRATGQVISQQALKAMKARTFFAPDKAADTFLSSFGLPTGNQGQRNILKAGGSILPAFTRG